MWIVHWPLVLRATWLSWMLELNGPLNVSKLHETGNGHKWLRSSKTSKTQHSCSPDGYSQSQINFFFGLEILDFFFLSQVFADSSNGRQLTGDLRAEVRKQSWQQSGSLSQWGVMDKVPTVWFRQFILNLPVGSPGNVASGCCWVVFLEPEVVCEGKMGGAGAASSELMTAGSI